VERSDLLVFVWFFLAFLVLQATVAALPDPWGKRIGAILYFAVMIGGLFLQDIILREIISKYPYIKAVVRPYNEVVHLYIKGFPQPGKKVWGKGYATELALAFGVKFKKIPGFHDKIRRVVITHHDEWNNRIRFQPGKAVFAGIQLDHPQVEVVELYPVESGQIAIDRAESIPVFHLHSASQDYYRETEQKAIEGRPAHVEVSIEMLRRLQSEVVEAKRKAAFWQQQALAYEAVIEQQKAEERGIIKSQGEVERLSVEHLLTIYQAQGSIQKALKAMQGSRFQVGLSKLVVSLILGILAILYLWANPDVAQSLVQGVFSPVGLLVIVVLVVGAYYLYNRRAVAAR